MQLRDSTGSILTSNDDKDDAFEELLGIGNVFSHLEIESLPYTGKFYVYVAPFYGTFNNRTSTFGNNAAGAYKFYISMPMVTDIRDRTTEIPTQFSLSQNYPNPFNAGTIIQIELPEPSDVRLSIYNIIGQKIVTLVNQKQVPGTYSINWNGMNAQGYSCQLVFISICWKRGKSSSKFKRCFS